MNVRRIGYRYQRTLLRSTEVVGIGFLTGAPIRLRFNPAPPSTGTSFCAHRFTAAPLSVAAQVGMVSGTQRRTTLGRPPVQVALVEHVLAALAGMRVDNCFVELNGPEPPGLDGSAQQFVDAIRRTGVRMQPASAAGNRRRRGFGLGHPGCSNLAASMSGRRAAHHLCPPITDHDRQSSDKRIQENHYARGDVWSISFPAVAPSCWRAKYTSLSAVKVSAPDRPLPTF